MTEEERINLQTRIDALDMLREVMNELHPTVPNVALFLKDIMDKSATQADVDISTLESKNSQLKNERAVEEPLAKVREERVPLLSGTDYTMLSDSPLTSEEKVEMREYRQYLRDLPSLWSNSQILEAKAMSIEEWRLNKPIY